MAFLCHASHSTNPVLSVYHLAGSRAHTALVGAVVDEPPEQDEGAEILWFSLVDLIHWYDAGMTLITHSPYARACLRIPL